MTRRDALRHALLAAAVALSAAGAAHAQDARPAASYPAPAPITAPAADARLREIADPAVRERIVATIVAAGREGLPTEPLLTKAIEGVEKGAPPARIEAAVRSLVGRLAAASDALTPVVSPTELVTGADAIGTGVPVDVLRGIRDVLPGRSSAVPLGVVAQLTARGVPALRAGAAVAALVKGGAGHAQILELGRRVQEDIAFGGSPSAALDFRAKNMISALQPMIPQAGASTTLDAELRANAPGASGAPTPTSPRRRP